MAPAMRETMNATDPSLRDSRLIAPPLLTTHQLNVVYHVRGAGAVSALRNVTLEIQSGDTVGIVGETGSGKSTLAKSLLGLVEPSAGTVTFRNQNIYELKARRRFQCLGREMSYVFQDPRSSLNPRHTVGSVVKDPLEVHPDCASGSPPERVSELLERVGLPSEMVDRPIRALSGGQLQRVAIARALALDPSVLIADEPTSALDLSVQGQILNLLKKIVISQGLTLVVVTHDVRVVRFLTDRTAVMLDGTIIEMGPTADVIERPQHEYTRSLVAAVPTLRV